MAKSRTRTRTNTIIEQPIVVQQPRALARRRSGGGRSKKRGGGKRHRRVGGGGGLTINTMGGYFAGGAAVGWIEKTWGEKLPILPIIGRKGAIALGAYYLRSSFPFAADVARAGAAIAGYQFGHDGSISGEDDEVGSVAREV